MDKLFKDLTSKEKEKLLKLLESTTLSYKKNLTVSFNTNDNLIGIILEGKANIIEIDYNGNETIKEELNEGAIFGTNISSLDNDDTSIVTKEDTKILLIDYDFIINTDYNTPYYNKFVKNLLDLTTNIIKEKNNRIQLLTKKTIRDKLLEYFDQNASYGTRSFTLPFNYSVLADYLAINRSAMQRELKSLKDEGIIETKGKKIYLKY